MTGGLLALLDDIAAILDDVSVMTKIAAQKTAGVLGDDLALNAQLVSGVRAHRELPVVWAVAKGSAVNKAILVPAALAISALAPWAIPPLLMAGGLYLCFEGVEKLAHKVLPHEQPGTSEPSHPSGDIASLESAKVRGAIRTDFVLSAEIITITLGTVAAKTLVEQVMVLTSIALIMTVGVYGLVAGIVRLDDIGLFLSRRKGAGLRGLGWFLLGAVPHLMRMLAIVGTAAMFLVGGSILTHGLPGAHDVIEHYILTPAASVPTAGAALTWVAALLVDAAIGIIAGSCALLVVRAVLLLRRAIGR